MKKFASLLVFIFVAQMAWGMGGPAPAPKKAEKIVQEGVFLIDDFESRSLKSPREWWTFDLKKNEIVSNNNLKEGDPQVFEGTRNYSLYLAGEAKDWYCGGVGTYLAKENQDLTAFSNLQLDIYGNGKDSGTIRIELFDDDNNNWQVEQDPKKNYAPIYDDKYVSEIRVDWPGWKREIIPLADFVDDNAGVGDDIWNPQPANGSGGLLQVQFIATATSQKGKANFYIDNVMLVMEK